MAPEDPVRRREGQVGVSCEVTPYERALEVNSEGTSWNIGLHGSYGPYVWSLWPEYKIVILTEPDIKTGDLILGAVGPQESAQHAICVSHMVAAIPQAHVHPCLVIRLPALGVKTADAQGAIQDWVS